jgi:signal transduction histidine kinase
MSLHGKIVAWFIFFASLTVMLFVLGDYYQSTQALRVALEARGSALAGQAATEIERRYERAGNELLAAGHDVAAGTAMQPLEHPYMRLRVLRDDAVLLDQPGAAQNALAQSCAFGNVNFSVPFRDGAGHAYRVEASMRVADFFAGMSATTARLGRNGLTSVVDRSSGALVYDHGCVIRSSAVPTTLEADVIAEVLRGGDEPVRVAKLPGASRSEERLVAIARSGQPEWAVAATVDFHEFGAPFAKVRTQYLMIMVAVMAIALVFVLRMIRNDMRRLAAISDAADAIGHGRFDVWLPPPTGDDVGRLSLSLGRMVDRLSSTIRQMEISRAMAAVGELATYLSHEIRNPLSSIRLNLQMLRRDLKGGAVPEDAPQLVALCLTELQRLDDVVRTVLEVGRKGQGRPGVSCYVHDVVLETVQVMHSKFRAHGVEVETRFGAIDAAVAIDPSQLKSVLINLLLNSVDALATAETRRIIIAAERSDPGGGPPALELRVSDTGPGVPAHLRERIFEPFFTTKTTGNGVGLATCLRIVQECGGLLRCAPASEWTGGAEFVLELPLAAVATPVAVAAPAVMAAS